MEILPRSACFTSEIVSCCSPPPAAAPCLCRFAGFNGPPHLLMPLPPIFPPLSPRLSPLCPLQVCFHGPREMVLPFFESLGFYCPERRGVADFLQARVGVQEGLRLAPGKGWGAGGSGMGLTRVAD